MKARIEIVENPDVESFSVAMPLELKYGNEEPSLPYRGRLPIFEQIAP